MKINPCIQILYRWPNFPASADTDSVARNALPIQILYRERRFCRPARYRFCTPSIKPGMGAFLSLQSCKQILYESSVNHTAAHFGSASIKD